MKRKYIIFAAIPILALAIIAGVYIYFQSQGTKGLMLLIEFEGTEGLENFAYELGEREIPSVLMADTNFVWENCEVIKRLQEKNIEIAGVYPQKPLWDVSFDEQKQIITDTKAAVEACTGQEMKIFASKYFAYDENTIKAAEELGIEYVMARGTTKAKATIYKPEEYDVKIFSVSNVSSDKWGTGSLCDYSYWAREGAPEDFEAELFKAAEQYSKVSPVSHTYIGGLKTRWNEVYLKFFDNTEIEWLTLEDFGEVDKEMPFDEIPDNREVQYEEPKPEIPLEEEENIMNPCQI